MACKERHADRALELAQQESDPAQRATYLRIADCFEAVVDDIDVANADAALAELRLGTLPLINAFLDRMGLEPLLDKYVPTTDRRCSVAHARALENALGAHFTPQVVEPPARFSARVLERIDALEVQRTRVPVLHDALDFRRSKFDSLSGSRGLRASERGNERRAPKPESTRPHARERPAAAGRR